MKIPWCCQRPGKRLPLGLAAGFHQLAIRDFPGWRCGITGSIGHCAGTERTGTASVSVSAFAGAAEISAGWLFSIAPLNMPGPPKALLPRAPRGAPDPNRCMETKSMRRGLYDFADGATQMLRRWRWRQQAHVDLPAAFVGRSANMVILLLAVLKGVLEAPGCGCGSGWHISLAIHHNFVSAACAEEICIDVIFLGQSRQLGTGTFAEPHRRTAGRGGREFFSCFGSSRIFKPCFGLSGCHGQIGSG